MSRDGAAPEWSDVHLAGVWITTGAKLLILGAVRNRPSTLGRSIIHSSPCGYTIATW